MSVATVSTTRPTSTMGPKRCSCTTAGHQLRGAMPWRMPPPSSGGQRQQVEHRQQQVQRDPVPRDQARPRHRRQRLQLVARDAAVEHADAEEEREADRQRHVRHRSGGGDHRHARPAGTQAGRVHRHRLAPAEPRDEQHERARRVEVALRVERHAPQPRRRVVTEALGRQGVRRLVERDGDEQRDCDSDEPHERSERVVEEAGDSRQQHGSPAARP